jgi:hypothetical protein
MKIDPKIYDKKDFAGLASFGRFSDIDFMS